MYVFLLVLGALTSAAGLSLVASAVAQEGVSAVPYSAIPVATKRHPAAKSRQFSPLQVAYFNFLGTKTPLLGQRTGHLGIWGTCIILPIRQ